MVTNISTNGNLNLAETTGTAQQARDFFDSLETVNLDEVTTTTLRVGIRDFRLVPVLDNTGNPVVEEGKVKMAREFYTRIAEIENFVPMRVFNRMMAARNRALKLRQAFLDNPQNEEAFDPMMTWMIEQILAVWQISEPDMTMERLENGLPFEKISRLFTLFFAHLLQTPAK